jgi:hypothetical protein
MSNRLVVPLFALLLCPIVLHGQSTSARLSGTVTDASGAVIPGASVIAVDTATGWKTTATSGAEGQYVLYPLPPGVYQVSLEKSGFQTVRIGQLQVYANDSLVRNVTLLVSAVAEAVTISATADAAALDHTPSVQSTITREQIENLPLDGRDYFQLVFLAAGALQYKDSSASSDSGGVAINGNRSYSNEYSVDGVSNNYSYQNVSAIPVSVDLIREFKVVSGVAPAEYGQGGSNVIMVSRSGTNKFHGSSFEYYRGDVLIARDPFTTEPPPPLSRHQLGGSLGGPVRLPRYDGRNRTFFFFNYEALRQNGSETRVATVAPDDFWKGDFSSLLPRVQLRDPLISGRPNIPNNRLDQYLNGARISPAAVKMRPFFPSPNLPGLANNSVRSVTSTSNNDQFTIRGDHLLPRNQSLSARLTYYNAGGYSPGLFALPNMGKSQPVYGRNGMAGWTATLGPRTVNEFRVGASNISKLNNYVNTGNPTPETVGIKGLVSGSSPLIPPMPKINFTGTDAFSDLNYSSNAGVAANLMSITNNIFNLAEAVSTTRGGHQIKAGFEGRRTYLNYLFENNGNGQMTFNGANAARSTGYSFADFMMGLPSSTQLTPLQNKVLLIQPEYAFYAQDDWRIRRNFTLSIGLRNEMFFHPLEERNRLAMFSPLAQGGGIVVACDHGQLPASEFLPDVVSRLSDGKGNFRFPMACGSSLGYDSRRLVNNMLRNWGPRVGFAWDPFGHGKWLVRSGYGIFYTRMPHQYMALTVGANPPFASLFNFSQTLTNFVPSITLDNPYPGAGASASITPFGFEPDFRLPSNQQWHFTIERALGSATVVSLQYVGNKGTHLIRNINLNMQRVDPVTKTVVRRYQAAFGSAAVNYKQADGNSIYNSLQTQFRRRFARGLSYQVNWTWAKGLDDVGQTLNATLLDAESLGRDRANSDYVRRHLINSNFTWELPFGRGKRFGANISPWLNLAAGGWRLSGIWIYSSGRYMTPSYTNSGNFGADNRPDVVSGVRADLPRDQRSPQHWFNPAAFAIPPAIDPVTGLVRFGNAGRNIIAGPGRNTWNGSLAKTFRIRESKQIAVRLDVFNLLNHPNWANPDTNISNVNTVATISDINGTMRQAQFALEFRF